MIYRNLIKCSTKTAIVESTFRLLQETAASWLWPCLLSCCNGTDHLTLQAQITITHISDKLRAKYMKSLFGIHESAAELLSYTVIVNTVIVNKI